MHRPAVQAVCRWLGLSFLLYESCALCHWRLQSGTGTVVPSTSNNLIFQLTLELRKLWQRLCAVASQNIFVFCYSSCCSAVAATWTLFTVLLCVILYATNNFHVVFRLPSHEMVMPIALYSVTGILCSACAFLWCIRRIVFATVLANKFYFCHLKCVHASDLFH